MWDYAKVNKDEIRERLSNIDWDSKFENLSVNDMVSEFTTTVLDILSRFIPNKIAICNDKDPPWITPEIKTAIKRKHRVYNRYVKRGRRLDEWENVRVIRNDTSKMITTDKDNHFASLGRKLSNPNIGIKKYWSTLNRIINKKNVSSVPPLIENDVFVTNFQEKANIFNNHFIKQSSFNINESVLPRCCVSRCNKLLETIDINGDNVSKIIRSFFLFTKRESRQLKKITGQYLCYQFVGNFCEKLISDLMHKHIHDSKLLTLNQSGFRQGDSTVNQLLYIIQRIYAAFEEYPTRETRAVFLDISEAFDKVWHDCLVFSR